MKSAAIFKSGKEFFIHSYSKTKPGYSVASAPFFRMDSSASPNELVGALREALKCSGEEVPVPDFSELSKKIATSFGLKSINGLERRIINYCSITLENEKVLKIVPTEHATSPEKGHLHKTDEALRVSYLASDEEIAQTIKLAFEKCS